MSAELKNSYVAEFQEKVPLLQKTLREITEKEIRCYFYININASGWYITLNIFEPTDRIYKVCIYSDATYGFISQMKSDYKKVIDEWIDSLAVVKRRQIERSQQIKEELIYKTPDQD
jgi:hypothetical protein